MEPGLYVLVPTGIDVGDSLTAPVALLDSVVLAPFDDVWKAEVRRHLESFRAHSGIISQNDVEMFDKMRHCLLRHFGPQGGGRPILEAVYDLSEAEVRRRVRASYALSSSWLRSFAVLILAGKMHFGCFERWFGLQIPDPDSGTGANCYESREVAWYGRVTTDERPQPADAEYWVHVARVRENLCRCPPESRPAVAAEMLARAAFSSDLRSELLWLWIVLEALFSPSRGAGELAHQLCERAAAFVELPGPARVQAYRDLKNAYQVRSKLVHGSLTMQSNAEKKKVSATIRVIEEIARRSLLKILADKQWTDLLASGGDLKARFENLVLDPNSS